MAREKNGATKFGDYVMTLYRFKVPVEALEKTVLAVQCLGVENYSLFENEDSPKSDIYDADDFPIASEFFLETDEQVDSLKGLGLSFEIREEEPYPEYKQDPIEIGDFIINPRHIPLYLEGSMAFGTGHHPTTKLCLEGIVALKDQGIQSVLDLGSGTGVLAVAASKVWRPELIHASDIEEIAVETTRHNCSLNHVNAEVFLSDGFNDLPNILYDVIIANILLNPLCAMASEIQKRAARFVILSGIIESQKEDLLEAFSDMDVYEVRQMDDWCMIIMSSRS